jgi:hypothetical protein
MQSQLPSVAGIFLRLKSGVPYVEPAGLLVRRPATQGNGNERPVKMKRRPVSKSTADVQEALHRLKILTSLSGRTTTAGWP